MRTWPSIRQSWAERDGLLVKELGRRTADYPPARLEVGVVEVLEVDPVQLAILERLRPRLLGDQPTAADAMRDVARLGDRIQNHGPPDWLVLGNEWEHLWELEEGFRPAQAMASEWGSIMSLRGPSANRRQLLRHPFLRLLV